MMELPPAIVKPQEPDVLTWCVIMRAVVVGL